MKPKDQWEEDAKDHFVTALKADGRGDLIVSDTDVVVDQKTNLNFDYQLQYGADFIALEVFRLVDSKAEIERQKSWNLISNSIAAELRKRGVKGFTISTPNTFDVPPNKVERFVSKIADNLQKAIEENPGIDPRRVSTTLRHMLAEFSEFFHVSWTGLLIHASVGTAGGLGALRTKRSG
jgi:hypothetical protein